MIYHTRSILKKLIFIIVLSYTSQGLNAQNFKWAKSFGNEYSNEAVAITTDLSGNVYSTGHFLGKVDFDPGPGIFNIQAYNSDDIFISKLDADGKFAWTKSIRTGSQLEVSALVTDDSGNVYVTGSFAGATDFDPDAAQHYLQTNGDNIFILKLDASGNFKWVKQMGGYDGVWDEARGRSIALDMQGNIYTTGVFEGTVDFDPGPSTYDLSDVDEWDIFISKLDRNGNFIWAKGVGSAYRDNAYGIATDEGGNVYATGQFAGLTDFDPGAGTFKLSSNAGDFYIWKLTTDGKFAWAKRIGGNGSDDNSRDIFVAKGFVYTTGTFEDTVDFDPGAGTFKLVGKSNYEIFISKLDTAGNFVWAGSMEGNDRSEGSSVAVDTFGNIYTTGYFAGTTDFDPGQGKHLLTAKKTDMFISKLDAAGKFTWAKVITCYGNDQGNAIAVDRSGNIYTTGTYQNWTDFDPGARIFEIKPADADAANVFVLKLGNCNVDITKDPRDTTVISGNNTRFITAASNPDATFQWQHNPGSGFVDLANGGQYSGVKNDTLLITNLTLSQTKYKYRCVVSDSKCSDTTFSAILTVNKNSSVQDVAEDMAIKLFPNPANEILTIQTITPFPDLSYTITDQLGRRVLNGETNEQTSSIDISRLKSGFYFIKIGQLQWQSFVVIK